MVTSYEMKLTPCFHFQFVGFRFSSVMAEHGSEVEKEILLEHHDVENVSADPSLTIEAVLHLSADQLRDELLQRGIDPKVRPKPQMQLELVQILKLEIVGPAIKSSTMEQKQMQLQKE